MKARNSPPDKNPRSSLLDFAISAEAVWACTACGACVEICPVNNEPMRDILDIRRNLVLMENTFPTQLQQAFKGMERLGNPWNIAPESRMDWAHGLDVPTIEQNPEPDILWWVGCAPATDPRAQKTARDFAKILNAAGVNFAVLGKLERCTGDSARRAGNEALFFELATSNVETLNESRRAQAHRHDLPALPAHAQERIPRLWRQLRRDSSHATHRRIVRDGQAQEHSEP